MKTWLAVVAALIFAGCIDSVDTINENTYMLSTEGVPAIVSGPGDVTLALDIIGQIDAESDHIGAHYWTSSQADPTAAISDSTGCSHTEDSVVGQHTVVCAFDAPGTYYLRGHMRYTPDDGDPYNYWAEEVRIDIVDLQLNASAGDSAAVGAAFNFTLAVTGDGHATSDHIGAHYWTEVPTDPTAAFAEQAGGCGHTGGAVPAAFTVTCSWSEAGTYHVFGHLRLNDGLQDIDLWSDPFTVTVA